MIINDERTEKSTYLEIGDLVKVEESYYLLFEFVGLGKVFLLDLDTNQVYKDKEFSHPTHVYHHLRKHYDTFEIIKQDEVELTIE